ncbi:MAG TPA: class I SAM-dependent methyltransferase [Stellaceae bacterium]|nr:class I SAM-dependent methyltransferase [Stellaceae bacterium]
MTGVDYHSSRLVADARRDVLWQSLWRYCFSAMVGPEDCVLDLGVGYCNFINSVVARRRIAIDSWAGFPAHLAPGIEHQVGSVTDLDFLDDGAVDFAFASNLFEHLTQDEFRVALEALRPKLSARGTLTILQPNYRYAYREYFDDFDHKTVYSHVSLPDYLTANGYEVFRVEPRFMPLSVKSRLPVTPFLIRAWLAAPIKPMGKQMLVRARPRR